MPVFRPALFRDTLTTYMAPRILIVDDSDGQRKHLRGILEAAGFEVDEAIDGVRGCAKVHRETFDGVICDVNMPYMDGIKFVALIKLQAHNDKLPVLMLTSESSEEMRSRGRQAGASVWMVKPFDPQELVRTVRTMLENPTSFRS